MIRVRFGFSFLTALLAAAAFGCSGGRSASSGASTSSTGQPAGSGTGTVQVLLTAGSAPNFVQSLVVTFDRVTIVPSGGGAMPLVEQGPVDLALNTSFVDLTGITGGATALLASGVVVNGDYDRVEVSVSAASISYSGKDGATNVSMRVRSGVVDIPASFAVASGGTVRVVLRFNTGGSVQFGDGQPTLHPMLSVSGVQ
jgi:hypothetical protein